MAQSFRDGTLPADWRLSDSAALTAPGTDPAGSGWMRLTPAVNNSFGSARDTVAFPSTSGVLAEFDFAIWGGTGADGLVFFLYDGAQNENTFANGQRGGSIGYAKCDAAPGLTGAYIGVAFDVYGNFSNSSFCNIGGFAPSINANRVVVRGGTPGYGYLTSAAASQALRAGRTAARHARVAVVNDKLTVYVTYPNGQIQEIASDYALPTPPTDLKFGFVAGTGGQNDNHEVRDALVRLPVDLVTTITDGHSGASRAGTLSWTATVTNNGPNPVDDADIDASFLTSGLTDVEWTCTTTGGGACATASGTGVPDTTVDLPNGAAATYEIQARAGAGTDNATMQMTATPTGATGEYRPIDNVASDSTDLSPVNDVAPSFTLSIGGVATANVGTWRGGHLTVTRQWQRSDPDGTNCVDIPGATGATYTVTGADSGKTLRLQVTQTNAAGTLTANSTPFVLPQTTLVAGPQAITASPVTTIDFSTATSGATLECSVDGAAYAPCTAPLALTGLADGAHTLDMRAVYGGLRDATPVHVSWVVDTTAPDTTVGGGPSTFTFTGGETYECRLDTALAFTPCASPFAVDGLAAGRHTLTVRARDAAGNVDGSPAVFNWTIEAPALTAEVIDPKHPATAGSDVTVRGTQVGVGCHLANARLAGCTVAAYADVPAGAARSAALRLIGTGRVVTDGTGASTTVDIKLNALGRKLMRLHPEGLRARLVVDAHPVGATTALRTQLRATLVPQRRTLTAAGFAWRSARLSTAMSPPPRLARPDAGRLTANPLHRVHVQPRRRGGQPQARPAPRRRRPRLPARSRHHGEALGRFARRAPAGRHQPDGPWPLAQPARRADGDPLSRARALARTRQRSVIACRCRAPGPWRSGRRRRSARPPRWWSPDPPSSPGDPASAARCRRTASRAGSASGCGATRGSRARSSPRC